MANPQLVSYIKQQLNSGYNISSIREYLIKYGYNAKDVDESIQAAYGNVSHVVHHVSKSAVLFIALIGIIFAFLIPTIYYYTSQQSGPAQLLDIKTTLLSTGIKSGSVVEFNVELVNMGKSSRYDVFLKHELVGTTVSKQETVAVETRTSVKSSLELPDNLGTGTYIIKTTADYNEKKAYSTFNFGISAITQGNNNIPVQDCVEEWECDDWVPEICPSSGKQTRLCEDINNCGTTQYKPSTTQSCQYSDGGSSGDNSGLTVWEKLDAIEIEAQTSPSSAKKKCADFDIDSHKDECYLRVASVAMDESICSGIKSDRTKDKCYNDVAKFSDNNRICEMIETQSRKDSCYMNFVNKGDYSVCEKIDNSYLREACTALRDMPEVVVT